MTTTLMQANHQWATRPEDERFVSLDSMAEHFERIRLQSRATITSTRRLHARPVDGDRRALEIITNDGESYSPTHFAFGQVCQRAEAPAGYLRTLPAELAADNLNFGLQFKRSIEDVGILLYQNGTTEMRACTGPNYGRIWNVDILKHLVGRFGDGASGDWKVPGEFGKDVPITKANTTLFAGDRDMFVFLADEKHRIENPARAGAPLARGFFVWNSEVGSTTFGIATFLFDYVCGNRIVWGSTQYKQVTIRHTSGAPDKFIEEMRPALTAYANSSAATVVDAIDAARKARIDGKDGELDKFLASRFSRRLVEPIKAAHQREEGRPIETIWDATTAVTAYAKTVKWQDERVGLERQAGDLLDEASK